LAFQLTDRFASSVRSLGPDQQERVIELHVGVTKLETIKNVPGLKHHETETRIDLQ
jgi:hypothetical protein